MFFVESVLNIIQDTKNIVMISLCSQFDVHDLFDQFFHCRENRQRYDRKNECSVLIFEIEKSFQNNLLLQKQKKHITI